MTNRTNPYLGVVVGVDGSPAANAATFWAAQEAVMRNIPLTIAHFVAPLPVGGVPVTWPAAPIPRSVEEAREDHARRVLAAAVESVRNHADSRPPEVNGELLVGGPVPGLVNLSKDAALLVVGSRGHSALGAGILGSVASGALHHSFCPVAVIHDADTPRRSGLPVLVGADGSQASEAATALAFDEASHRGVDLLALHVWSDAVMPSELGLEWSSLKAAADKILAESLAGQQERYPDVAVHRLLEFDGPVRHLLHHAEGSQLVVLGSHGRGGFAGMLLGSVSTTVAHAARVPVLVARQKV